MKDCIRTTLNIGGDLIFIRHSSLHPGRPTLLFLHGLGDSSLAFDEAFIDEHCRDFDIVAPDLPGHGFSPPAADGAYTLEALASLLEALTERMALQRLTVVGHSLGGDIATVFASRNRSGRIERIVNVEGSLTPADAFITNRAVEAAAGGFAAFDSWFHRYFCEETVFNDWAQKGEAGRRYYASLRFCEPSTFLACAAELYARNRHANNVGLSGIGAIYAALPMHKCFVYGTKSLPAVSARRAAELELERHAFPAGHWVMIDAAPQFYRVLRSTVLAM